MKMTLMLVGGVAETIDVEVPPEVTDDDALEAIVGTWRHALMCDEGHVMRFQHWPGLEWMVVSPEAIAGFSLRVRVLQ